MEISRQSVGNVLIEGKTKRVFQIKDNEELVYVLSKDRITAGDGLKAHEMVGKAVLSTRTNCALFRFLSSVGLNTHFVGRVSASDEDYERAFVAKKCQMIPIEWVARRVATGSYLKRNPHVEEGFRFNRVKIETFFKDDANHDPFWSLESIIGAKFEFNGLRIGAEEVTHMVETTTHVFELLERVWQTRNHSLIDMKIEFGVDSGGRLLVADVIDNDSWRLWPNGDKKLMLDKQVYRNLDVQQIDAKAIDSVRANFEIVAQRTEELFSALVDNVEEQSSGPVVVAIVLGSVSDKPHAQRIAKTLSEKYGIKQVEIHISSAHKSTQNTLEVIARLQQWPSLRAIIACAGMSNGLGPVIAGNATVPVINCPPIASADALALDVWSSLRMPSGIGCTTAVGADNAALSAALIVANGSPYVWARIRTEQLLTRVRLLHEK